MTLNCKQKLWSNGVVEGGFIRDNLHEQIQELDKKITLLSGNTNDEFINQIENDIKNVEYEILQNKELISINDKDIDNIKVDIQNIIDNMPTDLSNELELLETKINNTINQHVSDFNSLNAKISALMSIEHFTYNTSWIVPYYDYELNSNKQWNLSLQNHLSTLYEEVSRANLTAKSNSESSGLSLDQTIETQPFKNITDELSELMSVDKNKVVNYTIRELLENSAYEMGTRGDLYGITNTKISDIEARLSVLENSSPESSNTSSSGSSSGGLTLDQTIEVQAFKGITDELASKINITDKNVKSTLTIEQLLQMTSSAIGSTMELYEIQIPKINNHETRLTTLENKDFLDKEFIAKPFQMASDELLDSTGFTRDKEYTRTYKQWIENYAETQCMNMEMYWIDKPKIADHETRITTLENKDYDCLDVNLTARPFSNASDELLAKFPFDKNMENTYTIRRWITDFANMSCINMELYQIDKPKIANHEERITALEQRLTALEA